MKITDKKIILASLSVSLFGLSFFLYYTPEQAASELLVVAKFTKVKKDVRKKMSNSLDWKGVIENDEIMANDFIYTGVQSSTEIVYLVKDLKLKMPQTTVIKIEMEDDNPTFDIEEGSIQIEAGDNVKFIVKKGEKKHVFNNEKATNISVTKTGAIKTSAPDKGADKLKQNDDLAEDNNTDRGDASAIGDQASVDPETLRTVTEARQREKKYAFYFMIASSFIIFISSFFS